MTFRDKTFCQSPNCKNKCGRKMTQTEKNELDFRVTRAIAEHGKDAMVPVSWGYFCGEPENE